MRSTACLRQDRHAYLRQPTGGPQPGASSSSADLHRLAGALQRGSEHPLAKAVLDACADQGLKVPIVTGSQSLTGRGIAGRVEDRELALGNRRLLDESALQPGDLAAKARPGKQKGAPCRG